ERTEPVATRRAARRVAPPPPLLRASLWQIRLAPTTGRVEHIRPPTWRARTSGPSNQSPRLGPSPSFTFPQRRVPIGMHVRPRFDAFIRPGHSHTHGDGGLAEADEHSWIARGSVAPIGPRAAPNRGSVVP